MNSKLNTLLEPHSDRVYAVTRIMVGTMFAFHGIQKIFGVLTEYQPPVGSQLWIGGVLELVAGSAIALGVFTSISAFIASGMMAVAYFQFHWKFQFDSQFFPGINKGELAVLYSFAFLFMATKGSGIWSVAALIWPGSEAAKSSSSEKKTADWAHAQLAKSLN